MMGEVTTVQLALLIQIWNKTINSCEAYLSKSPASVNPDDPVTQVAIKLKVGKPQWIAEGSGSGCNEKQGSCIWQEACRGGDLRNNNLFMGAQYLNLLVEENSTGKLAL